MWGFPVLTWITIIGILAVLVTMLFDTSARPQLLWSVCAAAVVLVCAWMQQVRHGAAPVSAPELPDPQQQPVH